MTDQWMPREDFMEAVQRELIAFEQKERELRSKDKEERAEELHMLALKNQHQG